MATKFSLGSFEQVAKVDTDNKKNENNKIVNNQSVNNFSIKAKDLKVKKSLALRKSTIKKLQSFAKQANVSSSKVADKAIRMFLSLEN